MAKKSRYHRRPDGLLETTRTDKRTGKRVHFYGHTDRELEEQIMAFVSVQERGRSSGRWPGSGGPALAHPRPQHAAGL